MALTAPSVGQVLGRYRILERIGAGGMGVVYRAHDDQLDRDVALKVLPPGTLNSESARRQFRKEALAIARVNHANVAMAFDFGSDQGIDYLVTEYVPGVTLDVKLNQGSLKEKTAIELGIQLADGLAAAHHQGIVHRDLKPGNLRITPSGQLKILDFGLARLVEPDVNAAGTVSLTDSHLIAGTLPYMSPEQLRCEEVDPRTDLWAAGAVLYECVSGRRPFTAAQGPMLVEAILHEEPPPPSTVHQGVSPGLEAVILKCLDKDPERRYQSAKELRVDLARLLPSPTSHVSTVAVARKRRRMPRVLLVVAALLAGVAGFYVARRYWAGINGKSQQRVLAILPFDASGQDAETTALVRGVTETLTARLAQASTDDSLQLISTREIQAQGVKTANDAVREFGSDLVLEGSIHRAGDQMRINCSVVDSRSRRQLGARSITVSSADVFSLEDRVVSEVTDILSSVVGTRRGGTAHAETKPAVYAAYLRGRGYLQEYQKPENIDAAVREFRDAVQGDSNFALAHAGLGEALLRGYQQSNRGKDWVFEAEKSCQKALDISERDAESHICMGSVLHEQGKYEQAAAQFQRALTLEPSSEDALRGSADAYEKLGDAKAAEKTYRTAIDMRPRYWGVYSWLGAFYYRQGRYSDAEQQFKKVIELAPDNYRGYSNLGAMYVAQGRYSDSIETLKHSIAIRPNLEAYNNLAYAYFALRRFAESAETFQQALKLDDHDWLAWGNLGDALQWTPGRRGEAKRAYTRAIELAKEKLQVNPKDASAMAYMGGYYAALDDRKAAVENIEHAVTLAPADPDVRFRAAIVYVHLGDADKALDWLEKAVAAGVAASTIRDTPDFDSLRGNARYAKLVK